MAGMVRSDASVGLPLDLEGGGLFDNAANSEIVALEEDDLLAEFYAFCYEEAVLVGPLQSSPNNSPLRGHSPQRQPTQATSPTTKQPRTTTITTTTTTTTTTIPTSSSTSSSSSPSKLKLDTEASGPSVRHVTQATQPSTDPPHALLSREMLNALLAPKSWQDASGKWQRMVRATPSSRQDVQRLQEVFALVLEEHQARASAICPVREKFFLQVFEELIRECACECPERGLLLLRMRDELRMAVASHQTLYHSSIAYGRQKAVQAEAGIAELETRVQQLQQEQRALRDRKQQLTHATLVMEAQLAENEARRGLRQRQLVQFLRDQHTQLETFLQALTQETTWK